MPYATVSDIVNGNTNIQDSSSKVLHSLAKALGCSMDQLYKAGAGTSTVPEKFRFCFWDTDFDVLDTQKNKEFIISRLLERGGISGLLWIDSAYTPKEIREAIKKTRNFSRRTAAFASEEYKVPRKDMAFFQAGGTDWRH